MSEKKLKTNNFAESTYLMYAAFIISGIIGALYNSPFLALVGHDGFYIYDSAYGIFALFLDVSTSGIPIALSMIASEYIAVGKYRSKERAFEIGRNIILVFSILSFLFLQLAARQIGNFYVTGAEDAAVAGQIAIAVRIAACALLILPFLSVKRGYMQGHKLFAVSSFSQVIEQLVKVGWILASAYICIRVLHYSVSVGVYVGLAGLFLSGLAAYLFITLKVNSRQLAETGKDQEDASSESRREIIRKIITYCLMISIVSMSQSVYNIVNKRLVIVGLGHLGYQIDKYQDIINNMSGLVPKICMIVTALSMAMTHSIAPHIADSYARRDFRETNSKLLQVTGITFTISLPIMTGIILLASPVYYIFFGHSLYGDSILRLTICLNTISCLTSVYKTALQSMGFGKKVCYFTLIAIGVNICCDLPLIYLFNWLGLKPYLGASCSSIIAELVLLALLNHSLQNTVHFDLKKALLQIRKLLLPLAAMIVVVLIMKTVWPIDLEIGRIRVFLKLAVYALAGAAVYFTAAFFTGALEELLDVDFVSRIMSSLHITRKDSDA